MDLAPYIADLRHSLALAAATGGEDALALADRLTAPLEAATRLTLLNALSAAADEITRELAPGSVEVRLRGLDPNFVVALPPVFEAAPDDAPPPAPPVQAEGDDSGTTRINFRLPEHLKGRIEEAAAREGLSVNTWLVRTVAAGFTPEDRPAGRRGPRVGQHYTGWVR